MKPEWKDFLVNKGAEFDGDDRVINFGNPERELRLVVAGEALTDRSHTGLIAVHGEDASTFLQGQFTNDIREVSEHRSQISAFCSPKGRMLANFRIFHRDDSYYLHLPHAQLEATLKRLRMFVLRSKVVLEDASENFVRIGFSGSKAPAQLEALIGSAPAQADDAATRNGLTVIRLPGVSPRYEMFGELDALQKLWTQLDVHAAPVGDRAWSLLDVRAGVPVIVPETADAFVPQMANMQVIHGVSFKKGCYTGQEVVARMQYLGKLKRRMYLAHVGVSDCPAPGEALFSSNSESGQGAGRIVSAAPCPDGGCDLLAVVEIAARERDDLRLGAEDGPSLSFKELPYAFEPEQAQDRA